MKRYPDPCADPDEAFGPPILALATAQLLSWRQGSGSFGGLHLHACWGESSTLTRRYHGSTSSQTASILEQALELERSHADSYWNHLADALAAQLLWQQEAGGGFFHASSEFEPTYVSAQSCPIHQMLPVLALLDYHERRPAGSPARGEIGDALERHLSWFARFWWKRGNGWSGPLPFPGWCGVTNQDLVAVCALARYGEVFGDWRPYDEFGRPALETYLSPPYHDGLSGHFLRGDRKDFTERCSYLCLIERMLRRLHGIRPDPRIPAVRARIAETLADAVEVNDRGLGRMAWGLDDAESALAGRSVWVRNPLQISSYPEYIETLQASDVPAERQRMAPKIAALERMLAAWTFGDGTIPTAVDPKAPLLALVPGTGAVVGFWRFLIRRLGSAARIDRQALPEVPSMARRCGSLSFAASAAAWDLREGGRTLFRGVKRLSYGITRGSEELPNCPFPDIVPTEEEEVSFATIT